VEDNLPLFILVRGDILDKDYKKELTKLVGDKLKDSNMWIDDCFYDKKHKNLEVVIDSDEDLTIDKIVEATKIIDPIVDKADLINEKYILDVYGKSKGD
jgi:ribosome maturation factor RimP